MQQRVLIGLLLAISLIGIAVVWRLTSKATAPRALATPQSTASPTTTIELEITTPPVTIMPVATAVPAKVRRQPDGKRRGFDRSRADDIRRRATERRASNNADTSPKANTTAAAADTTLDSITMTPKEAKRRRDYVDQAVREQYFPVALSCYQELLARQPTVAGKVVMSFAIVGDGEDGVVERVELGEGTTMADAEFTLCMRESMYAVIFEPPPSGAAETTVVFPIELAP